MTSVSPLYHLQILGIVVAVDGSVSSEEGVNTQNVTLMLLLNMNMEILHMESMSMFYEYIVLL